MLTKEANERLTQVGMGTPMGALLRRYWHPVATLPELLSEPVLAVTVLGENLALYRTEAGDMGLVAQRCPHRGASLAYGIPEADGLRCAYHGWKFDGRGTCLEQPAEPADSTFKDRVRVPAYPVQEMGGLIWAYLGPTPAPLLPRFDLFEYGIVKRRLWVGDSEDSDEWQVGHPILFPNILSVGDGGRSQFQIRVPIDDTHTYHVWYRTKPRAEKTPLQDPASIPVLDYAYKHEDGRLVVDTVSGQDMMVWVTQGPISDRTTERLGTTDKGVIMYRALLEEQMLKVERGEEPMAVVRDPAKNTPMIDIARERNPFQVSRADVDMFALRKEVLATSR